MLKLVNLTHFHLFMQMYVCDFIHECSLKLKKDR